MNCGGMALPDAPVGSRRKGLLYAIVPTARPLGTLRICSGVGRRGGSRSMNVLDAIGNTSLVRLRKVVPAGCAQILVKHASDNSPGLEVRHRAADALHAATASVALFG